MHRNDQALISAPSHYPTLVTVSSCQNFSVSKQVNNLIMADCNQMDRLKELFQRYDECTIQEIPALYDGWSKEYNQVSGQKLFIHRYCR